MPRLRDPDALPAEVALERLRAGNDRFVRRVGQAGRDPRPDLAEGQRPFAVVVGCSDSRTPVELLFDQTFGELFVVRVAGAAVSPAVVGSVEFAVAQFGVRLVVVLGHTRCGAVEATAHSLRPDYTHPTEHIRFLTEIMAPLIAPAIDPALPLSPQTLRRASRTACLAGPAALTRASPLLGELASDGHLVITSAEYELETGQVHWLV